MKRVLIISEPGRDGVFVFVDGLIRHLHEKHPGIGVDLLYSSARPGPALPGLLAEVAARGGIARDLAVGNAPQPRDVRAWLMILQCVRERRPDIVHAHSSKAGALARIAGLFPGFPPVLYAPHAYYGMPCLGGIKERLYNGIESVLGRTSTTHNTSGDERQFAFGRLRLPPRSLVLIQNGVDVGRYAPADPEARRESRERLGLPPEAPVLVTVGRVSTQKNYALLYQALDRFLPGSGVFFAHAGAGSTGMRASLSQPARERSVCWEHLDEIEVLLRAADAFVLTSLYEGLSLSMLQALACGLSPILSDVLGHRTLAKLGFQDIRWVALSSPSPLSSLLSALGSWAAAPRENLAGQRRLALNFFDQSVQYEKVVRLYGHLARWGR